MKRSLRASLARAALFALPHFAAAAPIEWSLRGGYLYTEPGQESFPGVSLRSTPGYGPAPLRG